MSDTLSVFSVMRLVRDARSTRNAERQLLDALVLRCNPQKKYSCWPSYGMLSKDTQLNVATLQRAAKRLEDAQLIRRTVRANRSNVFWINVAKLQEQAAAAKEAESTPRRPVLDGDASPFADPTIYAINEDPNIDDDASWAGGGAQ